MNCHWPEKKLTKVLLDVSTAACSRASAQAKSPHHRHNGHRARISSTGDGRGDDQFAPGGTEDLHSQQTSSAFAPLPARADLGLRARRHLSRKPPRSTLSLGGSPGWITWRGFDVSARSAGYGRSTRPVAMDSPPMPRSRRREPLIQRLCRRHRLGVSPSRIMQVCGWLVAGHNDCRGIRGRPAGESQPPRALHANLAAAIDDDPNVGRDRRSARIGR